MTDDDGRLMEITSSVISFTLGDDVRARLERGEETWMHGPQPREADLMPELLKDAHSVALHEAQKHCPKLVVASRTTSRRMPYWTS